MDTRRRRYEKRLEALRGVQQAMGWRSRWQELSDYILPYRGVFSLEQTNRGAPRGQKIIDPTATRASKILAAGMMSGLTSPSRPWFRLASPDPDLNRFGKVKSWLTAVQEEMERIFAASNLYNVLPSLYQSAGVFGTAAAFAWDDVEEDPARTGPNADAMIRFEQAEIGSFYIATSSRGYVTTIYRELRMTVEQVVTKFGLGVCSAVVRNMWDRGDYEQMVDVVHAVEPRALQQGPGPFARNMPFASCWYEAGRSDETMLRESGFPEFPGLVPRWLVAGQNVYGDSAGMDALPDVKQLQSQRRRMLEGVELATRPSRVASKDVKGQVSNLPGGVTVTDAVDARAAIAVPFIPQVNLEHLRVDIEEVRQQIRGHFHEDLFLMLTNVDREVTATEIAERKEEKLLMLGPVLERLEDELLDPLIDRCFAIMQRRGRFLPGSSLEPPPELQGQDLRVEYVSILAQAQRAVGTSAMDRQASAITAIAPVKPEILEKWNVDKWLEQYTERLGLDHELLHTDEDVAAARELRQQRETMARMAEAAPGVAGAVKDLSDADLSNTESAAARALRMVGAA